MSEITMADILAELRAIREIEEERLELDRRRQFPRGGDEPRIVSPAQAGAMLGVAAKTVRTYERQGLLTAARRSTRGDTAPRYYRQDIEHFERLRQQFGRRGNQQRRKELHHGQ